MTVEHLLKCDPKPFQMVMLGAKCFEWRKLDRPYAVGDSLKLAEWDPELKMFTGRKCFRKIEYILTGEYGIPPEYGILFWAPGGFWELEKILADLRNELDKCYGTKAGKVWLPNWIRKIFRA